MFIEDLTFYKMSSGGEEPTSKEQTERPITTNDAKRTTAPTEPPGTTKEKDVTTKKKPTEPPTPPKGTEPQPNLKNARSRLNTRTNNWNGLVKLFLGDLWLCFQNGETITRR